MQFGKVCEKDVPALASLWREAFREDGEKLVPWLRQIGTGFCCKDGDALRAMAFALPYAVASEGNILDGRYLYGVATAAAYRRQGIASRLLEYAEQELAAEGADGLLLVPAGDELRRFYAKRGFRDWSVNSSYSVEGETPCGAEEYLRLREGFLACSAHIFPPEELMARCTFYKRKFGCRAVLFGKTAELLPVGEGDLYAMAKPLTEKFPGRGFFSFAMDE